MEDYNSRHSGPVIDDAVDRAKDGGALDQSLAAKPNPNLLDNWYFGNPVNQRGSSGVIALNSYGIDRWICYLATHTVNSRYITVSANGVYTQVLENKGVLTGKTLTASFLTYEGELITGTAVVGSISTTFFNVGQYHLYISESGSFQLLCRSDTNLLAAKLELGSQQTLVHQDENGIWVLNEIPDYGEQLRKCQRYYQTRFHSKSVPATPTSRGSLYLHFPLSCPMRTAPSVSIKSGATLENAIQRISYGRVTPTEMTFQSGSVDAVAVIFAGEFAVDGDNSQYVLTKDILEASADL